MVTPAQQVSVPRRVGALWRRVAPPAGAGGIALAGELTGHDLAGVLLAVVVLLAQSLTTAMVVLVIGRIALRANQAGTDPVVLIRTLTALLRAL